MIPLYDMPVFFVNHHGAICPGFSFHAADNQSAIQIYIGISKQKRFGWPEASIQVKKYHISHAEIFPLPERRDLTMEKRAAGCFVPLAYFLKEWHGVIFVDNFADNIQQTIARTLPQRSGGVHLCHRDFVNAVFVEVEIYERLKSISLLSKWN